MSRDSKKTEFNEMHCPLHKWDLCLISCTFSLLSETTMSLKRLQSTKWYVFGRCCKLKLQLLFQYEFNREQSLPKAETVYLNIT